MIFRRITVNNAGPFLGEWSVDLSDGATVIVGTYDEGSERSNRSGKSFFACDCPMYALFGQFRGKTDEFAHRLVRGKEDAWVEVEVTTSNGRCHSIRQGRTASGDPIREVDGASVKRDDLLNFVVSEVLGLTLEEWRMTNLFVQGNMHSFMEMTAAEKRRVVAPWFKTDRWVPRAELARKRLSEARAELRAIEREETEVVSFLDSPDVTADLETSKKLRRRAVMKIEKSESEVARLEQICRTSNETAASKKACASEVSRLEADVAAERRSAESELALAERTVESVGRDLETARDRGRWISKLEDEVSKLSELKDIADGAKRKLRDAEEKISINEARRKELLKQYNELRSSRTGTCPILREPCDRVAPDKSVLDSIVEEGKEHRAAVELLTESLKGLSWKVDMAKADLDTALENERELAKLRSKPSVEQVGRESASANVALERAKKRVSDAKRSRTELSKALAAAKKRLETFGEVEDHFQFANLKQEKATLSELRDHLADVDKKVAELSATVAERARAESRVVELRSRREEVQSIIEDLAFAAYAFGATGIPSREVENAFGAAENSMNTVLESLGAPMRVRFTPVRELKEWESACLGCGAEFEKGERKHVCKVCGAPRRKKRRDELHMEVIDGGNVSSFDLDSGGGKVMLSMGVRLGLARLPSASRAVVCQHLVVDEPDGALDAPNRAAVHGLIRGKMGALGVSQALLITHADARDEFDKVVEVRRFEAEDRSEVFNV